MIYFPLQLWNGFKDVCSGLINLLHSPFITEWYDFSSELKVKQCNSFFSIYQSFFHLLPHRWKCNINHLCAFFFSISACRCWRLVSSHLRQVSVVGGRPGRADQDHCCRYSGPIRQLWLADVIPADVQRHRTQLETVQTGGQHRGESILKWTKELS